MCPRCGYETERVGEAAELAWVCAKCGLEGVPGRAVLEPYPEGSGVENALHLAARNLAISTFWLLFLFIVSIACIVVMNVWTRQHDLTLWASCILTMSILAMVLCVLYIITSSRNFLDGDEVDLWIIRKVRREGRLALWIAIVAPLCCLAILAAYLWHSSGPSPAPQTPMYARPELAGVLLLIAYTMLFVGLSKVVYRAALLGVRLDSPGLVAAAVRMLWLNRVTNGVTGAPSFLLLGFALWNPPSAFVAWVFAGLIACSHTVTIVMLNYISCKVLACTRPFPQECEDDEYDDDEEYEPAE